MRDGDVPAPWQLGCDLQPFGMLAEHRIDDPNECFVAVEHAVPSSQERALQPALTLMLAKHGVEDASCRRKEFVISLDGRLPLAIGHLEYRPQHVRERLVRPKDPEISCLLVERHDVPQIRTQRSHVRHGNRTGRRDSDSKGAIVGKTQITQEHAGASLCALDKGATTFGISVLDGLMMATRCGSLDPGVIFYLRRLGYSLADIEEMLYNRSGLLGFSGISGDIRVLLTNDTASAREEIDLFTYRIALEVGAMASALGGVDGIVFTAGIGQNAPKIRTAVCARLGWLGLRLDEAANDKGACCISTAESQIDVRVMATDEEAMIAQHVLAMTSQPDTASSLSPPA